MSKVEYLNLLIEVRADYVAMARELHSFKQLKKSFDPYDLPLVHNMDKGIKDLKMACHGERS